MTRTGFDPRSGAAAALTLALSLAACGGGSDSGVSAVVTLPPTVTLASPGNGTLGNPLALIVTASDPDDGVAKVEFFDGSTLLGEDTTSPYSFSWTPLAAGPHTLTARATDGHGATTTSAAVTISILPPTPALDGVPTTATLTAPVNLAAGLAGTVSVDAAATDNVEVASVEFQIDGASLGAPATSAPYSVTLDTSAYPAGQHVLRARATDTSGNASQRSTALVQFAGSTARPNGFTLNQSWVAGPTNATAFAQAPDGRLFIAEQGAPCASSRTAPCWPRRSPPSRSIRQASAA